MFFIIMKVSRIYLFSSAYSDMVPPLEPLTNNSKIWFGFSNLILEICIDEIVPDISVTVILGLDSSIPKLPIINKTVKIFRWDRTTNASQSNVNNSS